MRPHPRTWILLWIIGIFFPLAFLGKLWPDFGKFFSAVFAPAWTHILMHGLLYAVLGFLLAKWIPPSSVRSVSGLLGLSLLVGILHEGVQILAAGAWPGWTAELLDLSVDLAGACLGLALARWLSPGPGRPKA
ncbi:MAG: hypothetical protein FD146_296 [Anaerolineaceae bacterium]|nr:MAG: hypothetical protein FD146_296 [Anaerolineaceae bacterium]